MKVSTQRTHSTPKPNHSPRRAEGGSGKKSGGDSFDKLAKKANGDMSEGELLRQQEKLQEHARLMTLKSNLIAVEHEMKKSIIANIRY